MDNNYKLNVTEVFYSNVCIYRTTCKQYAYIYNNIYIYILFYRQCFAKYYDIICEVLMLNI